MLDRLCRAVDEAADHYGERFKKLIVQDTGQGDVRSVNAGLVNQILNSFSSFVDPEILVVPEPELEDLLSRAPSAFTPAPEAHEMLELIDSRGEYMRRADAEKDPSVIQIIPCGVFAHRKRVLLFQRGLYTRVPRVSLARILVNSQVVAYELVDEI